MKKFNAALVATAVALCVSTPALAEDLVFTLKNGTHSVLNNFYTSPVGVNAWEDDVFGDQVLEPGELMEITIADGRSVCDYDMRFEFQGDELDTTIDTQNLCELGDTRSTNEGSVGGLQAFRVAHPASAGAGAVLAQASAKASEAQANLIACQRR